MADDKNAEKFMRLFIDICAASSSYSEVCLFDNKIAGLIFGESSQKRTTDSKKLFHIFADYIRGRYGSIKHSKLFIALYLWTEFKISLLTRKLDKQLVLFIVDKNYQGLGIGTALLNRYITHLKEQRCKTLYLYTDIESNWKYYEKYGFKKYSDFYDNGLSFLLRKRCTSFIYFLKLN